MKYYRSKVPYITYIVHGFYHSQALNRGPSLYIAVLEVLRFAIVVFIYTRPSTEIHLFTIIHLDCFQTLLTTYFATPVKLATTSLLPSFHDRRISSSTTH